MRTHWGARFAVHPGYVKSQSDGQRHFISGPQLARLYQLPPGSWVTWDDRKWSREHYDHSAYVHLYPRDDGQYRCPIEG